MRAAVLRFAYLVPIFLLAVGGGQARGVDAQQLLARMRANWASMTSLSARFEQRQDFAGFDEPLQSKGRLRLLRPSYFEMAFDPPNHQLQVCDGTFVWTYTEANRQVIRTPLSPEATRSADLLDWTLEGAVAVAASRDTTFGADAVRLDLQPGPRLPLATLSVWVRGERAELLGYEATDTDGNRTRLRLLDLKPAKGLVPADFRFRPPAGVEVIDMGTSGQ
jgi:outer membrane lipoprotein carrier protein